MVVALSIYGWKEAIEFLGTTPAGGDIAKWGFAAGYAVELLLLVAAAFCHLLALAVRDVDHLPFGENELDPQLLESDWRTRLVDFHRKAVQATRRTRTRQANDLNLGNALLRAFVAGAPISLALFLGARFGADVMAIFAISAAMLAVLFIMARQKGALARKSVVLVRTGARAVMGLVRGSWRFLAGKARLATSFVEGAARRRGRCHGSSRLRGFLTASRPAAF